MRNKKSFSLFLTTAMILSLFQAPVLSGAEELTGGAENAEIGMIQESSGDMLGGAAAISESLWEGLDETEEEATDAELKADAAVPEDELLSAGEAPEEAVLTAPGEEAEFSGYVLMNIPYDKLQPGGDHHIHLEICRQTRRRIRSCLYRYDKERRVQRGNILGSRKRRRGRNRRYDLYALGRLP